MKSQVTKITGKINFLSCGQTGSMHVNIQHNFNGRLDRVGIIVYNDIIEIHDAYLTDETIEDLRDVALKGRVVVDAHLAADLGVLLLADRQFLRFAEHGDLLLARDRVGGAGARESDGHARRKKEAGSFSHG